MTNPPVIQNWQSCKPLSVDPDNEWWRLSQRLLSEGAKALAADAIESYAKGLPIPISGGLRIMAVNASPASAQPKIPDWVHFPGNEWETIPLEDSGLDVAAFREWTGRQKPRLGKATGGQEPETGGVAIARAGYLLHSWGDPNFRYQSASLGKTFTRMALQLAVDEGLIGSADDPVMDYWTGDGLLEAHKVLDRGHHRQLTFQHLQDMVGGFPVTNGYVWRSRGEDRPLPRYAQEAPAWAIHTGDPDYDNYAHIEPGLEKCYSSGGYWRLSQALTSIWKMGLKEALDRKVMAHIGIPPDRWDWLTGEAVRRDRGSYPETPGYGDFLDPPYTIDDVPVHGGGGWVVMGATDFARVGLLIATGGIWQGRRLISQIGGNTGVGAHTVQGWGVVDGKAGFFSFGKVAAAFEDPTPDVMAPWIAGPVHPRR